MTWIFQVKIHPDSLCACAALRKVQYFFRAIFRTFFGAPFFGVFLRCRARFLGPYTSELLASSPPVELLASSPPAIYELTHPNFARKCWEWEDAGFLSHGIVMLNLLVFPTFSRVLRDLAMLPAKSRSFCGTRCVKCVKFLANFEMPSFCGNEPILEKSYSISGKRKSW